LDGHGRSIACGAVGALGSRCPLASGAPGNAVDAACLGTAAWSAVGLYLFAATITYLT